MGAATDITLGGRIRAARKAAGYRNPESFAVALGVSASTMQRWETDKSEPSISRLREIAALSGQALGYFISVNGDRPDGEVA